MNQIEKLKQLSKLALNEKDYKLILKFILSHNFDSFSEIIKSEMTKEYKLCEPEKMTERYCTLQEISFLLMKYDISDLYINKNNDDE